MKDLKDLKSQAEEHLAEAAELLSKAGIGERLSDLALNMEYVEREKTVDSSFIWEECFTCRLDNCSSVLMTVRRTKDIFGLHILFSFSCYDLSWKDRIRDAYRTLRGKTFEYAALLKDEDLTRFKSLLKRMP